MTTMATLRQDKGERTQQVARIIIVKLKKKYRLPHTLVNVILRQTRQALHLPLIIPHMQETRERTKIVLTSR